MSLLHLLIVEDNPADRELLERELHNLPVSWVMVSTGELGLAAFSKERFDVLLVNLLLPTMSGIAVIRWCRDHENRDIRLIPIYVITGADDERLKNHALASGADGIFKKPYSDSENQLIWQMVLRRKLSSMQHMRKWKDPLVWFRGLAAAFIGGGAASVASGVISIAQTPEQYNLKGGLHNLLVMVGGTFLVSGIITAMGYLKQSPLPELEEVDTSFLMKTTTTTIEQKKETT